MELTFSELTKKILEIVEQNNEILRHLERINPSQKAEEHFNISQLCEYLPQKPSRATVYGWINQKKIIFHKRGKNVYFLKSEIDNWLSL